MELCNLMIETLRKEKFEFTVNPNTICLAFSSLLLGLADGEIEEDKINDFIVDALQFAIKSHYGIETDIFEKLTLQQIGILIGIFKDAVLLVTDVNIDEEVEKQMKEEKNDDDKTIVLTV